MIFVYFVFDLFWVDLVNSNLQLFICLSARCDWSLLVWSFEIRYSVLSMMRSQCLYWIVSVFYIVIIARWWSVFLSFILVFSRVVLSISLIPKTRERLTLLVCPPPFISILFLLVDLFYWFFSTVLFKRVWYVWPRFSVGSVYLSVAIVLFFSVRFVWKGFGAWPCFFFRWL